MEFLVPNINMFNNILTFRSNEFKWLIISFWISSIVLMLGLSKPVVVDDELNSSISNTKIQELYDNSKDYLAIVICPWEDYDIDTSIRGNGFLKQLTNYVAPSTKLKLKTMSSYIEYLDELYLKLRDVLFNDLLYDKKSIKINLWLAHHFLKVICRQ